MLKLFDRIFCAISALVMCQVPRFIELYTTRLSGHVAESKRIVNQYAEIAASFGLSLDVYISKFKILTDPQLQVQGTLMQNAVDRMGYLTNGYAHLTQCEWYVQPISFVRYFDWEIARGTFNHYTVGLSFTIQTGVWMVIGILLAMGIMSAVSFVLRFWQSRSSGPVG